MNAFVIGHVGRFTNQKNHSKLIDIFAAIKERKSDAYLLLLGGGELQDTIKKLEKERNEFHDSVEKLEKKQVELETRLKQKR